MVHLKLSSPRFPFNEILNTSKKFWALSFKDPRIKSLEQEAWLRIKQGLVHDINYTKLLIWINKFRELDIPHVSAYTPTQHILESIKNLDTVYEAWIFLEFAEYVYEKGILLDFHLLDHPHFRFSHNGRVVTFWYEKTFVKSGEYTWVLEHRPDFTAMLDNEILAVFDAKNYTKSSPISDTQNKMLAYMTNLDVNFGALIFPNYPKYWDDLNKYERIGMLIPILSAQCPMNNNELQKIAKNLANLSWRELPVEYSKILPPKHVEIFENKLSEKKTRYRFDQTLCLFRMSPTESEYAVSMKKDSLGSLFEAIVSRIKI